MGVGVGQESLGAGAHTLRPSAASQAPEQMGIHTKALSPIWALGGLAPVSEAPLAGSLARAICSCKKSKPQV